MSIKITNKCEYINYAFLEIKNETLSLWRKNKNILLIIEKKIVNFET